MCVCVRKSNGKPRGTLPSLNVFSFAVDFLALHSFLFKRLLRPIAFNYLHPRVTQDLPAMAKFDDVVDQWVTALVQLVAFLMRFLIIILPLMLAGPIVDFITCWRYMITACGLQYIWLGKVTSSVEELRASPNNVTDGSLCFNFFDATFQCFYGLPLIIILAFTVLIDIFTYVR